VCSVWREMILWQVWHPRYGVVYDELQAIKRGRYGPCRGSPQELEGTGMGKGHDTASAGRPGGVRNAVGEASGTSEMRRVRPEGSKFKAPHAYRAHQGILGATEKIKRVCPTFT